MDPITQLVKSRLNGQESTAAHACLHAANIHVSTDRRGRALANVLVVRLSRSVKSESTSLNPHNLARHLQTDLTPYCDLYSHEGPYPPKCT